MAKHSGAAHRKKTKQRSYLHKLFHAAKEDFSLAEITAESVGGIVIALLAKHFAIVKSDELPELFFLCIGCAIAVPSILFLTRIVFIAPYKIVKESNQKLEESEREIFQLKDQRTPLEIEVASTVAVLSTGYDPDQRVLAAKNDLNDCTLEIHNPNPTQAIGGVELRLLKIDPPMENARTVAQQQFVEHFLGSKTAPAEKSLSFDSTDYCGFDEIKFPIPNLNGDQKRRIRIFTAERYGYGIVVKFDCQWKGTMANEFTPNGEHVLTLEVAGSGLQTQITRFKLLFFQNPQKTPDGWTSDSTKSKEPVFTIEKI